MTAGGGSSVLALRAAGLGDLLTAVPALRAIRRAFPDRRLVLATSDMLRGFALRAGLADEVCAMSGLEPIDGRVQPPAMAINLHGRGPQSHRVLLATHPRRLLAFANPAVPQVAGPRWIEREHQLVRWCRLLGAYDIEADPDLTDVALPPRPPRLHSAGATLIHPGAASAARRWPVDRFAAVARAEIDAGRRVILTGSRDERPIADAVAEIAGVHPSCVTAGEVDLIELAAMIGVAARVVCGDTGVAHLATALRTPSVVLFGPVDPAEWGPPPGRPEHIALWAGVPGDPHGTLPDPGLLRITVEDVLRALACLPEHSPDRASRIA